MINLLIVVVSLCSLFLSWYVLFVVWPETIVHRDRQRLFLIRDDLFAAAEDGKIGFSDKAYKLTRDTINANIRYLHKTSLVHVLILLIFRPRSAPPTKLDEAIEELDSTQQKVVVNAIDALHQTVFISMIDRSWLYPVIWVIEKFLQYEAFSLKLAKAKSSADAIDQIALNDKQWLSKAA